MEELSDYRCRIGLFGRSSASVNKQHRTTNSRIKLALPASKVLFLGIVILSLNTFYMSKDRQAPPFTLTRALQLSNEKCINEQYRSILKIHSSDVLCFHLINVMGLSETTPSTDLTCFELKLIIISMTNGIRFGGKGLGGKVRKVLHCRFSYYNKKRHYHEYNNTQNQSVGNKGGHCVACNIIQQGSHTTERSEKDVRTKHHLTSVSTMCGLNTSQFGNEQDLRMASYMYLLGNKGVHCYHGNPRGHQDEAVLTKDAIQLLIDNAESVGYIQIGTEHQPYGTGFRVGGKYLFTDFHVFRSKIDEMVNGVVHLLTECTEESLEELKEKFFLDSEVRANMTSSHDVVYAYLRNKAFHTESLFATLEEITSSALVSNLERYWGSNTVNFLRHGQFTIDWKIAFGDEETDTLILQLNKSQPHQCYPAPMLLDENYRQHGKFMIVRYQDDGSPSVTIDQNCRIFTDNKKLRTSVRKAVKCLKRKFPREEKGFFEKQYENCKKAIDDVTGQVIIRASKSFKHGSSGSPIVYLFNDSGPPVVNMVFQGGYPEFYYEAQDPQNNRYHRFRNKYLKRKCFFERGRTMKKLAELLEGKRMFRLKADIFCKPKASVDKISTGESSSSSSLRLGGNYQLHPTTRPQRSDLMEDTVAQWKEANTQCLATEPIKTGIKKIVEDGWRHLCFIGPPGSGRSTAVRHLALHLQENHGFTIYHVKHADQFEQFYRNDPSEPQVFVFDDILGKHKLDETELRKWRRYDELIRNSLLRSGKTVLLFSMTTTIYYNPVLKESGCVFYDETKCIDLGLWMYQLKEEDMHIILLLSLSERDVPKPKAIVNKATKGRLSDDLVVFFPFLCKCLSSNAESLTDPTKYFDYPLPAFLKMFYEIRWENPELFCGFVLIIASGGTLAEDYLDSYSEIGCYLNQTTVTERNAVMETFNLDPRQVAKVKSALAAVEGIFVSNNNGDITFLHPIFQTTVLYVYENSHFTLQFADSDFINKNIRLNAAFPDDNDRVQVIKGRRALEKLAGRLFKELLKETETGAYYMSRNVYIDDESMIMVLLDKLRHQRSEVMDTLLKHCVIKVCMEACLDGRTEKDIKGYKLVVHLAQAGADSTGFYGVGLPDGRYHLVHLCARTSCCSMLRALLDNGANPNSLDHDNCSALHHVCQAKHSRIEMASLLLEYGCRVDAVNKKGETLLHCLIRSKGTDKYRLAELFLQSACPVDSVTEDGHSIFHYLVMYKGKERLKLAELLLKHGCPVNLNTYRGVSILHYIAMYRGTDRLELAEQFLKNGCIADIHAVDYLEEHVRKYEMRIMQLIRGHLPKQSRKRKPQDKLKMRYGKFYKLEFEAMEIQEMQF